MEEIKGKRIKLRRLQESDLDQMWEWTSDPEVSKWVSWETHKDKTQTKDFLIKMILRYDNKASKQVYGIELLENGKLIGMIDQGFSKETKNPYIGYISNRKYWNKGYMTESLKTFLNHLFSIGFDEIYIQALIDNKASNRVIEKAGFTFINQTRKYEPKKDIYIDLYNYVIKKEDFFK